MTKIINSERGVITWKRLDVDRYECSHCGGIVDFSYAYCPFCGRQALNASLGDLDFDDDLPKV